CMGPSVDERSAVNPADQAPIDEFKKYWHCTAPTWDSLYRDACRQVRTWLRASETPRQISRLTQVLFCESQLAGRPLQYALQQSIDPTAPAPKPSPPPRAPLTAAELAMAQEALDRFDRVHGGSRPRKI